jgi:FkbM family methyltransferase
MRLYEIVAGRLIGTPLQVPAEWLRRRRRQRQARAHPELAALFDEERQLDEVMRRVIGADTNCIDIGCHLGAYLQKIVTLAPKGRHRAVEPVPDKARWLRRKFPAVEVLDVALGERSERARFFVHRGGTAYSGLAPRSESGPSESLEVECRSLDEVVPADAAIGFIKLDVNGGELPVLRGARSLLARDRPFLLLGVTQGGLDDYGLDADEVHAFLTEEAGYRVYLPRDWLEHAEPLSRERFRRSMQYPFAAFNYAACAQTQTWST